MGDDGKKLTAAKFEETLQRMEPRDQARLTVGMIAPTLHDPGQIIGILGLLALDVAAHPRLVEYLQDLVAEFRTQVPDLMKGVLALKAASESAARDAMFDPTDPEDH